MKKIAISIGVGTPWILLAVLLLRGNYFNAQHASGVIPHPASATDMLPDQVQTGKADVSPAPQPAATSVSESPNPILSLAMSKLSGASLLPGTGADLATTAAMEAHDDESGASASVNFAAAACASTNLPAALDWLATLPEGEGKTVASIAVAYEAARNDPVAALRLASPLPASRERDELLAFGVSQWTLTDADAATAWAATVPDTSLRQQLLAGTAIALAEKDGAAAATLVGTVLSPGPGQNCTAVSVVQVWAQTAPQATAGWVMQFPNAPTRVSAVRSLISIWAMSDATAAADWLNALPVGPDHDAGLAAYAQAMASL